MGGPRNEVEQQSHLKELGKLCFKFSTTATVTCSTSNAACLYCKQ